MMNGTINGEPRILAGADAGLASWDPANGGNWTLNPIPAPIAATGAHLSRYITVADVLPSSVVGTCLGSVAFIITIKSATTADWRNTSLVNSAVHLPQLFKNHGYKTLGAGKLFHAHTFFDPKYLSGFSDPKAWDNYFPSLTQQMPAEAVPATWPVNSSKDFYGGHFDWSPLQIETSEMADAKVVAWAKQQLAKKHDKPLFLSVGIYRPHVPWYAPQKYFDRFPLESIQLRRINKIQLSLMSKKLRS